MAAGLVYHNITTATGVTFSVAKWVPDTSAPDVGAFPVSMLLDADGNPILGSQTDPKSTATDATAVSLMAVTKQISASLQAMSSGVSVRTVDSIAAGLQTDALMNGLTALTPKFAVISKSASGDNELIAAVTGKKIRVVAYNFMAAGTVNAKFRSATTDITGLKYCVANVGIVAPFNPLGWFETAAAAALNVNLSAAVAIGGELVYVEV